MNFNGRDIPLQDNPRFSTETQRINGFRQSTLPDRGDRILEDIRNGNYNCAICFERIDSWQKVWSCKECHNVWHFPCAQTWAKQGPQSFILTSTWKCPGCSAYQPAIQDAHCWCGKTKQSAGIGINDVLNSCDLACDKTKTCPHGRDAVCNRLCHPGPCNQPCSAACPIGPVREPDTWNKAYARLKTRKPGSVCQVLVPLMFLVIIYGFLGAFIVLHMRWWTMPYLYPGFLPKWGSDIQFVVVLGGILVVLPSVLILGFYLLPALRYIIYLLFDLQELPNAHQRASASGAKRRSLIESVMSLICLAAVVLPIVGLAGLPDIAWYNQMKDSCEGYNTRIWFEKGYHRYLPPSTEKKFAFKSLSSGVPSKDFSLGTHLEPKFDDNKDFQFYHRLSGQLQGGAFIAVDVDTEHNLWRIKQLSHNDDANQWESYGRAHARPENTSTLFTPVPTFTPRAERLVMNGTIGTFNENQKHMFIPDLSFVVQNMYDYMHSCSIDPFVRVFNTRTVGNMGWDLDTILGETWNGKGKKDKRYPAIEMRTASFGHGTQDITVCAKEDPESAGGRLGTQDGVKGGIREDLLVPFAILSSFHERSIDNSLRTYSARCGVKDKK